MGIFGNTATKLKSKSDPEVVFISLMAEIKEKALRLTYIRSQLDNTIREWNVKMADAVPEGLEIKVSIDVEIPGQKRRAIDDPKVVCWNHEDGLGIGKYDFQGKPPDGYSQKKDVVALLPDLEQAVEKEIDKLLDEVEKAGGLALADSGQLSHTDESGGLSEVGNEKEE